VLQLEASLHETLLRVAQHCLRDQDPRHAAIVFPVFRPVLKSGRPAHTYESTPADSSHWLVLGMANPHQRLPTDTPPTERQQRPHRSEPLSVGRRAGQSKEPWMRECL
jgi:hypothetical protein